MTLKVIEFSKTRKKVPKKLKLRGISIPLESFEGGLIPHPHPPSGGNPAGIW
jgi:hypothetical protein